MPKQSLTSNSYPALLSQLKSVFIEGLRRIEEEKVRTYWRTGEIISNYILENKERAEYGDNLFIKLAEDLEMERSTLQRAVKFYRAFPISAARHKLTWSHYRELITVADKDKRLSLEKQAVEKEWDYRRLAEIIRLDKLKIDAPKEKLAVSPTKLSVIRSRLYAYKVIEPGYIHPVEEEIVVDAGFYINTQVALKGIAKPKAGQTVESAKTVSGYTFKLSPATNKELYTYKALVESVSDADTIWVNVDCGFNIWIRQKLRLRGIDAPEISTAKGEEAKRFAEARLKEVNFVIIKTHSSDKYGRYLADIFYLPAGKAGLKDEKEAQKVLEEGIFLNQELLDNGLARVYA